MHFHALSSVLVVLSFRYPFPWLILACGAGAAGALGLKDVGSTEAMSARYLLLLYETVVAAPEIAVDVPDLMATISVLG